MKSYTAACWTVVAMCMGHARWVVVAAVMARLQLAGPAEYLGASLTGRGGEWRVECSRFI